MRSGARFVPFFDVDVFATRGAEMGDGFGFATLDVRYGFHLFFWCVIFARVNNCFTDIGKVHARNVMMITAKRIIKMLSVYQINHAPVPRNHVLIQL